MTPRNTRRKRRIIGGIAAALVLVPTIIWALFGRPSGRADVDCTGGMGIYMNEAYPLLPGTLTDPGYHVSDIRYVWGKGHVLFGGGYLPEIDLSEVNVPERSVSADLALGESVHHEGVGTFTLIAINPTIFRIPMPGSEGGSATVCFQPDPDFDLDPKLAEHLNAHKTEDPDE